MSESVAISIPITNLADAEPAPTRTYRLDLDKGRIVGMIDGLEAVKQAIAKAIITPRFKCLIYDNQYGSEIEEAYIQRNITEEYIEATAERFVRDALLPDDRILNIYNFKCEFANDEAHISFTADTTYGKTNIEEVV